MERRPFNWGFLAAWVFATTLGWLLGMATTIFVLVGPIIGITQAFVLRTYVSEARRWVTATAWGWLAAWFVLYLVLPGDINLVSGLVLGLGMGAGQWLVMRQWFDRPGWWVVLSGTAWAVAASGLFPVYLVGLVAGLGTVMTIEVYVRYAGEKIEEDPASG